MHTEAEAFACVAVMMAAADGVGTLEESHYLFDTMADIPVFRDLDAEGFLMVLAEANRRVFSSPRTEDGRLTEDGVAAVLHQVRDALSPSLRAEAVRVALELAGADEVSAEEAALMERLRRELLPAS